MHALYECSERRFHLRDWKTKDSAVLLRPSQMVRGYIPRPAPCVANPLPVTQERLAFRQRVIRSLPFDDDAGEMRELLRNAPARDS
jgi:hypothetical protein